MWRKDAFMLVICGLACMAGCNAPAGEAKFVKADKTKIIPASMPSPDQADAEYKQAMEKLSALKYDDAEPAFFRLGKAYESFGQYSKAAECLFWRAYCQEKLGRGAQAAQGYEELKRFYPQTPAAQQARGRLDEMGR